MHNPSLTADAAELSSLSSVIHDITERVEALSRRYEGTEREDVSFELYEVERNLRGASRRIDRLTRNL